MELTKKELALIGYTRAKQASFKRANWLALGLLTLVIISLIGAAVVNHQLGTRVIAIDLGNGQTITREESLMGSDWYVSGFDLGPKESRTPFIEYVLVGISGAALLVLMIAIIKVDYRAEEAGKVFAKEHMNEKEVEVK